MMTETKATDAYTAWVDHIASVVMDEFGERPDLDGAFDKASRYLQTGEPGKDEFYEVFRGESVLASSDLSATKPEHIKALVKFALHQRSRCEEVHFYTDRVMETALKAISDGAPNPAGIAREAFAIATADFSRWYV